MVCFGIAGRGGPPHQPTVRGPHLDIHDLLPTYNEADKHSLKYASSLLCVCLGPELRELIRDGQRLLQIVLTLLDDGIQLVQPLQYLGLLELQVRSLFLVLILCDFTVQPHIEERFGSCLEVRDLGLEYVGLRDEPVVVLLE